MRRWEWKAIISWSNVDLVKFHCWLVLLQLELFVCLFWINEISLLISVGYESHSKHTSHSQLDSFVNSVVNWSQIDFLAWMVKWNVFLPNNWNCGCWAPYFSMCTSCYPKLHNYKSWKISKTHSLYEPCICSTFQNTPHTHTSLLI